MTFDEAIQYLQDSPFPGGSDRYAIGASLMAVQAGGLTLSLSAEMNIPSPPQSPREIQTGVALSTSGNAIAYLSSRVSTVVVPPNYDPGETFDQPFYAADVELGNPVMAITISRPRVASIPIQSNFEPDSPAFSDSSDTGLVASCKVEPLQDFYPHVRQFSIRLHDLGPCYAGIGPAVDGTSATAFYVISLNGEEIPG